jgi:hypothetical protein
LKKRCTRADSDQDLKAGAQHEFLALSTLIAGSAEPNLPEMNGRKICTMLKSETKFNIE